MQDGCFSSLHKDPRIRAVRAILCPALQHRANPHGAGDFLENNQHAMKLMRWGLIPFVAAFPLSGPD